MIQANELRLGNWVCWNDEPEVQPLKVTGVFKEDVFVQMTFGDGSKDETDTGYDSIRPIPLTPEILEACGFVLRSHKGHYNYHSKVISEFCNSRSELSLLGDTAYFNGAEVPYPEYLHQLQNLFFCLVGEELDVKVCDANQLNQGTES